MESSLSRHGTMAYSYGVRLSNHGCHPRAAACRVRLSIVAPTPSPDGRPALTARLDTHARAQCRPGVGETWSPNHPQEARYAYYASCPDVVVPAWDVAGRRCVCRNCRGCRRDWLSSLLFDTWDKWPCTDRLCTTRPCTACHTGPSTRPNVTKDPFPASLLDS